MIYIIIFVLILILILPNKTETFVSDTTIQNIINNKDILHPGNSVNKIKKKICNKKNCIDIVDHYKLTKMYNNNPESLTFSNIDKELNYK